MFRYRKSYKKFKKDGPSETCVFCNVTDRPIIKETKHVQVIANIYPYDIWEHRDVTDHLLLMPKKHVKSLAELPDTAKIDIINFISEYENNGYDVYARAVNSKLRSIPLHQHTHLIKATGKPANISLYVKKPYIVTKL